MSFRQTNVKTRYFGQKNRQNINQQEEQLPDLGQRRNKFDENRRTIQDDQTEQQQDLSTIRDHLWFAFEQLSPVNELTDIQGFKGLLCLVAKSLIVSSSSKSENDKRSLQEKAFNLAFQLMPESKQEQFEHLCSRRQWKWRSLLDLRKYLQDEIILYCRLINSGELADSKTNKKGEKRSRSSSTSNKSQASSKVIRCLYCKLNDHKVIDCIERYSVLCMRCLNFGHNKNHCRNELKRIGHEDFDV